MTDSRFSVVHSSLPARERAELQPALILMRGLGDTEAGRFSIAGLIDPRLHVPSVRPPLTHLWGGYSWFDLEQDGPGLGSPSIEATLDRLRAFLDEIIAAYPVDPRRLYVGRLRESHNSV